jgi:TolB-like protein/tetratricopeptide (TPR) repeat protein
MGVWERLKQHKVAQWTLAYAAAGYTLLHAVEMLSEAQEWPHVIARVLSLVLILGVPIVITLAWYHGARHARRVSGPELTIITILLVLTGSVLWALTRTGGEHGPLRSAPVAQEDISHSPGPPPGVPAGVSLAVLPFVDMSPEHNQDYFSDGLSEEVLNQLAQIKELRVTGRTSSFSFKGKNEDLRVIGETLGVNHLLEGSVRKADKRLRVTAQLINAADGTHLWSHSYDSELTDVFAVQEQIATEVARALSISLDVGEMSRAKGGTTNVDAYDIYLHAQTLLYQLGRKELLQSTQLYRQTLALDPNFARAWSGLYTALEYSLTWIPENSAAERKEMTEASAQIVALAPDAWWTQTMREDQFIHQHKWSEAEAAASAALASAPASEIQVLTHYGYFLIFVGRTKEAVDYLTRAREMDPLSLGISGLLQVSLDCAGRPAEAQAEYERSKQFAGDHETWDWWAVQRLWSRKDAAPADVEAQFRAFMKRSTVPTALAFDQILLERLGNREAALTAVREAFTDPSNQDGMRIQVVGKYADHFGDRDLALAAYRRSYVELDNTNYVVLWEPSETGLRSDPRFKDLLRDLGLADYFRKSGTWGNFCKPLGKDDFECH